MYSVGTLSVIYDVYGVLIVEIEDVLKISFIVGLIIL